MLETMTTVHHPSARKSTTAINVLLREFLPATALTACTSSMGRVGTIDSVRVYMRRPRPSQLPAQTSFPRLPHGKTAFSPFSVPPLMPLPPALLSPALCVVASRRGIGCGRRWKAMCIPCCLSTKPRSWKPPSSPPCKG